MLYFLIVLEKFRNKYRIPSARMQNWDYRSNSPYFITICTAHRELCFGSITNSEINLTTIGEIVVNEWLKTPVVRPDMNIILDEFVIMPNHFHGIIFIGKNEFNSRMKNPDNNHNTCRDAMPGVSTKCTKINRQNQFGPQVKNLSSVIRGFKSSVTTNARKINPFFAWQPRFHDIIIHNNVSYQRIKNYIVDNPNNWDTDDYWK